MESTWKIRNLNITIDIQEISETIISLSAQQTKIKGNFTKYSNLLHYADKSIVYKIIILELWAEDLSAAKEGADT